MPDCIIIQNKRFLVLGANNYVNYARLRYYETTNIPLFFGAAICHRKL